MAIAAVGLLMSLSIHGITPTEALPSKQAALELLHSGKTDYAAGQFSEAVQTLNEAAQAYQAAGDVLRQAQALSFVSLAEQKRGRWTEATAAINQSQSLLNTLPQSTVQAQVLNTQGHLQLALGQAEAALKTWQQAEALYTQASDRTGVMGSQINQAQALEALGFYRRSCRQILQAFQTQSACEELTPETLAGLLDTLQTQPPSLRVIGLRSLGNVLRLLRKLDESQQVLEQSLTLAHQSNLTEAEAKALLSLGNTQQALATKARDLNDLQAAQTYAQAALDNYRSSVITASTLPLTALQAQLNELSLLVDRSAVEALKLLSPIQEAIERLPPSRAAVYTRIQFVHCLVRLKEIVDISLDWADIAQILKQAEQIAVSIEDKRAESYALGTLGQLTYAHLPNSTGQTLLKRALTLASTENAPEIAYQWQWQLGRIYRDTGDTEAAIAAYQAAFINLQKLRGDLVTLNQEIQFSFREQVEPVYRELAGLLLESSQSLPDQERLRSARQVIEALQIAQLDNYFQDACATLKSEEVDRVDPQAAIFYTILLPERLEVILSSPDGTLHRHVNRVSLAEVEQTVNELQRYLKEPDRLKDVQKRSQSLYNWLIRPFENTLSSSEPIHTLVFVLDTVLQNIPMAVLYDGEQYLVQKYATAITPGLRLLRPERLSPKLNALVAGVSESQQVGRREFTALENVEDEWKMVQATVPSETLLNSRLTRSNLEAQFDEHSFSVIHLATHGQFSSDPEGTFILLWNQVLNVNDLDRVLPQPGDSSRIELLVLSACETATGDKRATLGLAGVAVRGGASSTLATLWQVNDQSTATLMGQFYQELSKTTKAEALRRAQLKLWENIEKDWQVPSFWGAYVLVGNWL